MPFFSRTDPEPEPVPVVEPDTKRHGLFGRHRDTSPVASTAHSRSRLSTSTHSSSTSNSSVHTTDTAGRRSILHRTFGHGNTDALDPSIVRARERVIGAEAAEREADRALDTARRQVREAREHVQRLEAEAKEEARLAKVKQAHAHAMSKRAKPLGRHGN